MSHRLQSTHFSQKKSSPIKRDAPVAPQWPSYQGQSQFVGTSPSGRVTVFVDPSLGDPGLQNAQDLVNDADRVASANDQIFGTTGGPVSVIVFALGGVTDGTGGADDEDWFHKIQEPVRTEDSPGPPFAVPLARRAELSAGSVSRQMHERYSATACPSRLPRIEEVW